MTVPSWTIRFSDRSAGSTSPPFSGHSRTSAASSLPLMVRASDPPMKERRSPNESLRPTLFTNRPPLCLKTIDMIITDILESFFDMIVPRAGLS